MQYVNLQPVQYWFHNVVEKYLFDHAMDEPLWRWASDSICPCLEIIIDFDDMIMVFVVTKNQILVLMIDSLKMNQQVF